MMFLAVTSHHSPGPRTSSSPFSMWSTTATSEVSKGLLPWKRESSYVPSSILGFNVGERISKHEYKTTVDQAQGCT